MTITQAKHNKFSVKRKDSDQSVALIRQQIPIFLRFHIISYFLKFLYWQQTYCLSNSAPIFLGLPV